MKSENVKLFIGLAVVGALFLVTAYLVQTNLDFFKSLIGDSVLGMIVYVLIAIVTIVVAPITMTPLIPIASNVWGWQIAGLLSLFGWIVGSVFAFMIARKWGVPIVRKFVSLKDLYRFEKSIPQSNVFIGIVLLRIIFPVDVLSYALGIFSKVPLRTYTIASLVGMAPLAFVLAYLGSIPTFYQLMGIGGLVLLIAFIYIILWWRGVVKS